MPGSTKNPSISSEQREANFNEFLKWYKNHCTGSEKSQAQTFLTRLIEAFGNRGVDEVGAHFELKNFDQKSETQRFADFVWPERVIIEMKERGRDLKKDYQQILDYWVNITPKTKYAALCNFDKILIYDFNIQMDNPIHEFDTSNLLNDYQALIFLSPVSEKPVFKNNLVEVTEDAAQQMGEFYQKLLSRKIDQKKSQRFVLQLVVAMFSEDAGLIPKSTLFRILDDAVKNPTDRTFAKQLRNLFTSMATKKVGDKPADFKEIKYFNGGIFSEFEPIDLQFKELAMLHKIAGLNWGKIRPSIFGSIFQSTVSDTERHTHGIHYTSENDIMKIVLPTIVRPFQEKIKGAGKDIKKLKIILDELRKFKVLDPACGSGNFLYLAFISLRRLEIQLRDLIGDQKRDLIENSYVSPKNFYGIDTNAFGLELAKVALSLGRKISNDEFGYHENVLPFENLDDNFINGDALFIKWPEVETIIGNPPFLGRGKTKSLSSIDPDYVEKVHSLYSSKDFPKSADYCCYWFRKAHDSKAKYIGLVGSNSITQGNSRKASLDYILKNNGEISFAISSEPWEGDAKVHVSIVNWAKVKIRSAFLDGKEVSYINSSLKNEIDVTKALKLKVNLNKCFQGVVPQPLERYLVDEKTAVVWFEKNPKNSDVVKRLLSADDLTDKFNFKSDRFLIDFSEMNIEEASTYKEPFLFVKKQKENNVGTNNSEHKLWWQLWRSRPKMKASISGLKKYIAMPGHSKWFIPVIVPVEYLAYVNSSFVISSNDYYDMGILTSKLHRDWVKAQCSTLKGDTRYTNTTCFETFPFLWNASEKLKNIVRERMKCLDEFRVDTMKIKKYGITKLYNEFFNETESKLYKLHQELNEAVYKVYEFKNDPDKNYNEQLLKLNKQLWEDEKNNSNDQNLLL